MIHTAKISDCGKYRYALTRQWAGSGGGVTFIMLNPSTADAEKDDPTIRRCIGFAKLWGFSRLQVVNLFAYRATDPKELDKVDDPVGPLNDPQLINCWHGTLVAAWGAKAPNERVKYVLSLMYSKQLFCLGTTKKGHPRHPLYVPANQPLVPFYGDAYENR